MQRLDALRAVKFGLAAAREDVFLRARWVRTAAFRGGGGVAVGIPTPCDVSEACELNKAKDRGNGERT